MNGKKLQGTAKGRDPAAQGAGENQDVERLVGGGVDTDTVNLKTPKILFEMEPPEWASHERS